MTPATDGPMHVSNRLMPLGEPVVVNSPPAAAPAGGWLTSRTAVVALVLFGIALRLVPLAANRDLWIDEAMLALNLIERTPAQLLKPLDWNQGAPAGFLLAVKATISMMGESERALRLFPFVGSALGLIGFAWLSRKLLPAPAATLAVALAAINPYLISYAAECKQYATDAAIAIGLFAASHGLLSGEGGWRRWSVLALAGAVAVWFSHPATFVLGGIGTALFADAVVRGDRTRVRACVLTIGCWLTSFGACYVAFLKALAMNQYLLDYWAEHFLPLPPKSPGDVNWILDHFFAFFGYPGGLSGGEYKVAGIGAGLFLIGLGAFWRERWPVVVAVVVPAALALVASGLHKYPFAGRLLLFYVPIMLLVVARGAWAVASALRPTMPLAAFGLLSLLVFAPLLETYQQMKKPLREEQITEVLAELRGRVQAGDKVFIYWGGVPAFTFYTRNDPFPVPVVLGVEHRDGRTEFRDELRQFIGEPRVWVVFSHRHRAEESLLRAYSESLGECRESFRRAGATAFRYDFRGLE